MVLLCKQNYWFGDRINMARLTYTIIDPFILQAWISLHTVLKTANLKSRQQRIFNKLPNNVRCIAGFVSEVLICETYARCHGLAHFNCTVTFNSAIFLHVSQLCTLLYLMWSKCRYLAGESSPLIAKDLGDCCRHHDNSKVLQYSTIIVVMKVVFCDHR